MVSGKKESAVTVAQYDEKVKRRSLDDPLRQHRRSSIPFVDRKPAVRFIRSIEQRKNSVAGPNQPTLDDASKKPILKKSDFPIFVIPKAGGSLNESVASTNDELENCKIKADLIMDRISRADRIARGSMDVLTFPTATHRIEALSRYQGSMTISICTIDILTTSGEYSAEKRSGGPIVSEMKMVLEMAQEMQSQAREFQATAKTFLSRAKHRYNEWEKLLKRSTDFKIDHSKLSYPIYSHKRMPESVTLYEDVVVDDQQDQEFDGYVRICRSYPEDTIALHCDSSDNPDQFEPVNFHDSPLETQAEVIKFVTGHGRDLLMFSDTCLRQGLDVLVDQEMDEAFDVIRNKISSIEYDETFDPLCSLELKNALGELVSRKAELLNTAEQIVQHCQRITAVSNLFCRYTKRSVKGGSGGSGWACCFGGSSKQKLLRLLGMVAVDDITILLPLTLAVAQDIFHMDPFNFNNDEPNNSDN